MKPLALLRGAALGAAALALSLAFSTPAFAQSASRAEQARAERAARVAPHSVASEGETSLLNAPVTTAAKGKPSGGGGSGGGGDTAAPAALDIRLVRTYFNQVAVVTRLTADDGSDPTSGFVYRVEIRYAPASGCGFTPANPQPTPDDGLREYLGPITFYPEVGTSSCFSTTTWGDGSGSGGTLPGRSVGANNLPFGEAAVYFSTSDLEPGTEYLFALRAVDDAGNKSALSLVARVRTDDPANYLPWGTPEVVASPVLSGTSAALAFDASGRPAVAYSMPYSNNQQAHVARFDGTTWNAQQVDANRKLGDAVRLHFDGTSGTGRFLLAYGGNTTVRYAELDAASGSLGQRAPIEQRNNTSFSLGSVTTYGASATPLVAYSGPSGKTLARRAGTSWSTAPFPDPVSAARDYSLATKPNGTLGIAYNTTEPATVGGASGTLYRLFYAESSNGGVTWSDPVEVDQEFARSIPISSGLWGAGTWYPVLAFDPAGIPAIAYQRGPAFLNRTVLAWPGGSGGWVNNQPVYDEGGGALGYTSDGTLYVEALYGELVASRPAAGGDWTRYYTGVPGGRLAVGPSGPAVVGVSSLDGVYALKYVPGPGAAAGARAGTPTAAVRVGGGLPAALALSEAYPNPFHASATLDLRLEGAQPIRAEVFDAIGRRVAVLHEGMAEAGVHRLTLEGSGLPAGLYVVRVTGAGIAATQRVTLLR